MPKKKTVRRRKASIKDYKLKRGKGLDRNQLGKYNLFHLR